MYKMCYYGKTSVDCDRIAQLSGTADIYNIRQLAYYIHCYPRSIGRFIGIFSSWNCCVWTDYDR